MKLDRKFLGVEELLFDELHFVPRWTSVLERDADMIPSIASAFDIHVGRNDPEFPSSPVLENEDSAAIPCPGSGGASAESGCLGGSREVLSHETLPVS